MNLEYSIIIPVKSINDYVRETVGYILNLESPYWELFIISNQHEKSEWSDARIKVISSGRVGPGRKRDLGATISNGQVLVFLDDDSYPAANLLEVAEKYFWSADVVAIGGPGITPDSDGFWQRVSGAVFLSKFSGGAPERYLSIGPEREVDDWPSVNLMVRKEDFLKVGGFNTDFWPGEDTKLCLDLITKTAKKIIYVPNLIVWHHRRAGFMAHLKQVGAYGLHRGYFAKKYPKTSLRLKYFAPSILFCIFVVTVFSKFISPLFFMVTMCFWAIYTLLLIKVVFDISKSEKFFVAIASVFYVASSHLIYGIRFLEGLLLKKNLVSKLR
jgi:GT2 family glycosyltransferase